MACSEQSMYDKQVYCGTRPEDLGEWMYFYCWEMMSQLMHFEKPTHI